METFSPLLVICEGNPPVTGEFPSQRPVTQSFPVFFDLHLNKPLSKQSRRWWFETPSCPYDVTVMIWTAIMVMYDMTTLWHENAFHYMAAGSVSNNVPVQLENFPWNTTSIPKCLMRCQMKMHTHTYIYTYFLSADICVYRFSFILTHYTPPSKSLASLWLAGQLVVIPLLRWPFFQEYSAEYFQILYDKC